MKKKIVVKILNNNKVLKIVSILILGSLLLTISAKIKIPFYPVPMTMQTFVVIFLGLAFGSKLATATVGIYLIEGLIGLPIFSNSLTAQRKLNIALPRFEPSAIIVSV